MSGPEDLQDLDQLESNVRTWLSIIDRAGSLEGSPEPHIARQNGGTVALKHFPVECHQAIDIFEDLVEIGPDHEDYAITLRAAQIMFDKHIATKLIQNAG